MSEKRPTHGAALLPDLSDSREERAAWPEPLSTWLDFFAGDDKAASFSLVAAARRYDKSALRLQSRHRISTLAGIWLGTAALLLAAATLCLASWSEGSPNSSILRTITILTVIELALVFATLVVVGEGLAHKYHLHWLLERHRTERLRFLKFAALANSASWHRDQAKVARLKSRLSEEAIQLANIDESDLRSFAEESSLLELPVPMPKDVVIPFYDLAAYYRVKRLSGQLRYFDLRGAAQGARDAQVRFWPTWLFFAGLFLAGARCVVELVEHAAGAEFRRATALLLGAMLATLFLAAGVRTFRAAHELARNTARFRATYAALCVADGLLTSARGAREVLQALAIAEAALVSEHREWLRLMLEAEWFG
jgi:hypothetical protein